MTAFLKAHEKLILSLLAALLVWGVLSRVLTYLASHDQTTATASQQALQAQLEANKEQSDSQKATLAQYLSLAQQLMASNTALANAQTQRNTVVLKQQAVDKTLQPADLAARWTSLMKVAPSTVSPTAQGYSVGPDTATETVVQLEAIPSLQADLSNEKQINVNNDQMISGLMTVKDNLTNQVSGLNKTVQDESKSCADQITLVKAQARKSKLHWFEIGFVTGFVSSVALKVGL